MNRNQILTGYDKMRQDISKAKDEYLEEIFIYIKEYFARDKSRWNWEEFYFGLEKLIFASLEETYSITAAAVKSIYGIQFKDIIDQDTLKELTYSEDGKTLEERLKEHWDNAIKRDDPTLYFYNRVVLIMDTETLYASNHVIHGKLKRYATHVEVIGAATCLEHEECDYYTSLGKIPIEKLDKLPPYHPDCECEVIYYIDEEKI